MLNRRFLLAANPDFDSSLPYLVSLPLGEQPLVLKTRERWPATTAVYCHRAGPWPADAEILEDVTVRSCARRGAAIDLVLDRPRHNRSQFVFTTLRGGREAIFWHSARTLRAARPGVRIPTRRASRHSVLEILIDTRERYPYRFAHQQASVQRQALLAGDYAVTLDGHVIGAVERKSLPDLVSSLVDGSLTLALAELAALPRTALVVEDRYANIFKLEHATPGFVAELLATMQVRYPATPIIFAETRPLAEEWTFRFLGAALSHALAERHDNPSP